jgi:hypothetical protein
VIALAATCNVDLIAASRDLYKHGQTGVYHGPDSNRGRPYHVDPGRRKTPVAA